MIFKKIKKLLIKIGIATMLVFAAINPVLGHTNNNKILLDLAHSDTMYYSNGTLIRDEGASYQGYSEREIPKLILNSFINSIVAGRICLFNISTKVKASILTTLE